MTDVKKAKHEKDVDRKYFQAERRQKARKSRDKEKHDGGGLWQSKNVNGELRLYAMNNAADKELKTKGLSERGYKVIMSSKKVKESLVAMNNPKEARI